MAFTADLTMRALTDAEMHAVAGDKRLIAVQTVRQHVMKETTSQKLTPLHMQTKEKKWHKN